MLEQVEGRIFSFGGKGRSYYVTRSTHSSGKDRRARARYHLTRVTRPGWTVVKISISAAWLDSLSGSLSAAEKIAISEKLIAEQLCSCCQKDKAREPPIVHP